MLIKQKVFRYSLWGCNFFLPLHRNNGESSFKLNILYCGVEQLVARWAHNPKAAGSSPAPATTTRLCIIAGPFLFTSDVHSLRFILGVLSEDIHRVHLQHGATAVVAQRVVQ